MTDHESPTDLVGIVVVSHSRALAAAAVALARQMVHGAGPRIAIAAGLDDGTLGTDAAAIGAALQQVDGPAGVVILTDLGSAVLSAELALELADPQLRERVALSPAALVEGLVAAVVTAAGGGSRAQVMAEAAGALAAKATALKGIEDSTDPGVPADPGPVIAAPAVGQASAEVSVTSRNGLHARPVARLLGELRGLDATVSITNLSTGAGPASGISVVQLTMLSAQHGHRLRIDATGPEAAVAVQRLVDLAARGFDQPAQQATTN